MSLRSEDVMYPPLSSARPGTSLDREITGATRPSWPCATQSTMHPTCVVLSGEPPAHWLMLAEVTGRVLVVPLAPANSGDWRRCRPIGC